MAHAACETRSLGACTERRERDASRGWVLTVGSCKSFVNMVLAICKLLQLTGFPYSYSSFPCRL